MKVMPAGEEDSLLRLNIMFNLFDVYKVLMNEKEEKYANGTADGGSAVSL